LQITLEANSPLYVLSCCYFQPYDVVQRAHRQCSRISSGISLP
jgi:hypothetical protein